VELLDKLSEGEDLPEVTGLHVDEVVKIMLCGRSLNAGIGRRRLQPATVRLSHVSSVGGEGVEESGSWNDPEDPVVLLVEDCICSEGFCHILMKVGWEGKLRIQIIH